jgi:hypothetical protein
MPVAREVILPTNAPIHTLIPRQLHLHLPLLMESILFLLQNYARGRVNHVVVEEAQEAPDIVLGMFFINANSTVVLFDSGASHSFISATYVEKHNLPIALLKCQMIVSSPGRDMLVRNLCPTVNLKIKS